MGAELMFNHAFDSPEWQSAAAVEGFAHFYSMLVFNDPSGGLGVIAYNQEIGSIMTLSETEIGAHRTDEPESSWRGLLPMNAQLDGVAVERDWAFFLWDTVTGANAISPSTVLLWLSNAYPWPTPSQDNSDWWTNFHGNNIDPLTAAQQSKAESAAASREVGQ